MSVDLGYGVTITDAKMALWADGVRKAHYAGVALSTAWADLSAGAQALWIASATTMAKQAMEDKRLTMEWHTFGTGEETTTLTTHLDNYMLANLGVAIT
jgi:hypothetical protein